VKGIVVDIRNKDVVVLSDEGSIIKIKNEDYKIGQEIQVNSNIKRSKIKFIAVVASFIIAFTAIGRGAYEYTRPYSYVSLDVNPSIEYSVNVFGRVIDASGINQEGKDVISLIKVENKTVYEAIEYTIYKVIEQGYIKDGEDGEIVITTCSNNEANAEYLADKVKVDVEKHINGNDLVAHVEAFSVGKERVLEAKALGVTPGKLNLVEKLQRSAENPDDISIGEWLEKPVKEIMKATKPKNSEQKNKAQEAVNSNKEQGEVTNTKDIVEKEARNDNENKSSNIDEDKAKNKAQSPTSDEKKIINTSPSENKSQSVRSNAEVNNKKAK
jgi:hypothetical protein